MTPALVLLWDEQPQKLTTAILSTPAQVTPTSPEGQYEIVAPAGPFTIMAVPDAESPHTGPVVGGVLRGTEPVHDLDLTLASPPRQLEGQIINASGQLLEQASLALESVEWSREEVRGKHIVIRRPFPRTEATILPNGRFHAGLPYDAAATLSLRAFDREQLRREIPPELSWVELELPITTSLTVRLTAPSDQQLTAAFCFLLQGGVRVSPVRAEGGEFDFEGLDPGAPVLVAAGGPTCSIGVFDTPAPGAGPVVRHFQLEPRAALVGSLVSPAGEPIPGASVRILGDRRYSEDVIPGTWESVHGVHETTTNELGEFSFDPLYPGVFELTATAKGDPWPTVQTRLSSGNEEHRVVFQRDDSEKALATVHVSWEGGEREGRPFYLAITEVAEDQAARLVTGYELRADGPHSPPGVPAGTYRIEAWADGWARAQVVRELEVGEQRVDLVLRAAPLLRIKVEYADGTPVTDERIQLRDGSGGTLMGRASGTRVHSTEFVLDEDGELQVEGIPIGVVDVLCKGGAHVGQVVGAEPLGPQRTPVDHKGGGVHVIVKEGKPEQPAAPDEESPQRPAVGG